MTSLRVAFSAALLVAVAGRATPASAAPGQGGGVIVIQGEAPAQANVPTATDPRASGGAYLALDTAQAPPRGGWRATYRVDAAVAGIYHLDAVVTSPAMADRDPKGGSWFELSVNGAPYAEVAKSEVGWAGVGDTPRAWGALIKASIGDVELRRGTNAISFRVVEPRVSTAPVGYRFLLDELTLTRTRLALTRVSVGDPARNLGVYRGEPASLRFSLNGRARRAEVVRYRIRDYFRRQVAAGTATVAAGSLSAAVHLPRLRPGHYRAVAALRSTPRDAVAGFFSRLPARRPIVAPANRFGITVSAPWLLPPSRVGAFARAVRAMGAGYMRDELNWTIAEPARGQFSTRPPSGVAGAFGRVGVKTLGALWTLTGDLRAPDWAITPASGVLPDDLRDAYDFTRHLAGQAGGADALEVWNEPDVDVIAGALSRTPGDRHAAYVKAATLGITDQASRPLASLSGVADVGGLQTLMLQNGAARYADLWAFHGYGYALKPGDPVAFPQVARQNSALQRLYGFDGQSWMTESGVFLKATRRVDLDHAQQVLQARYLVQSTVLDLAAGTDKHFWFSGAPYCAASFACFGLFDRDFQPWPSYSAHAAMASLLGAADFARRVGGLPAGVKAYMFKDGPRAVAVVWAGSPTRVRVPMPGRRVRTYDVMGARTPAPATAGRVARVTASPDPIYLVSGGGSRLTARSGARDDRRSVQPLSTAEHVVLDQRFPVTAQPKPEPYGYRLRQTTPMSVDVYNFNTTAESVTLVPRGWGGWGVSPAQQTVSVPAHGRVSVPFTVIAGDGVHRGADYPLVFAATVGGRPAPASVSRVLRRGGRRGAPVPLAPSITWVAPGDGSVHVGRHVALRALVSDALSGIDPARVVVEVDGHRVARDYDAATGRLSAALQLSRGVHELWIRAYDNAQAPAQATVNVTVR